MKRLWRVVIVVVAILALGGAAVGFVAAQTDGESESGERPNFVARLAENLGITQEELEAALQQTSLDVVDEAVANGKLTEEQADRIRERIESGEGRLFPHRARCQQQRAGNVVGQVADLLGLTAQDLVEALKDGQSLAQIAEANGVSADELKAFLLGEVEERLAQAVEAGKITQERADEILANASERIDNLINREGLPEGGPHRFRGQGGFAEPLPDDAGLVY